MPATLQMNDQTHNQPGRKSAALGLWIWRHFRIELPAEWEMLQFSSDFQNGRCVWADRYQYRAEFSWRRVPGPPQMKRMVTDYMARLKSSEVASSLSTLRVGDWEGLGGKAGEQKFTQLSRYSEPESCMLEVVLFWPDKVDVDLQQRILASISEEPERDGTRRWRVGGLDVLARYPLLSCEIQPGLTRLQFGNETADWLGRQTFERRGMLNAWMNATLPEWVNAQCPLTLITKEQTEFPLFGQTAYHIEGRVPLNMGRRIVRATRLKQGRQLNEKLLGYHAAAAIDPRDERLYFLEARTSSDISPEEARADMLTWRNPADSSFSGQ